MDRGAWQPTIHRVAESDTTEVTWHPHLVKRPIKHTHTHTHTHTLREGRRGILHLRRSHLSEDVKVRVSHVDVWKESLQAENTSTKTSSQECAWYSTF